MTTLTELGVVAPAHCDRRLHGDGCVRTCSTCGLPAYDVLLRSTDEVRSAMHAYERRIAFRFWRRSDGLLFTSDCPRRVHWRLWLVPLGIVALVASGIVALWLHNLAQLAAFTWR